MPDYPFTPQFPGTDDEDDEDLDFLEEGAAERAFVNPVATPEEVLFGESDQAATRDRDAGVGSFGSATSDFEDAFDVDTPDIDL